MANLRVCRFCLITDVRMEDITGTLEENIASIFGPYILYTPYLPPYVCYECAALVSKCNKFIDQVLLVHSILYDMLQCCGQVTKKEIKNIDRNCLKLKSNLSQTSIEVMECTQGSGVRKLDLAEGILLETLVGDDSSDDDYVLPTYTRRDWRTKEKLPDTTSSKNNIESFQPAEENIKNAIKHKVRKVEPDDDLINNFVITKLTREEQIAEVLKRKESSNYRDSVYKCNICYIGFLQMQTLDQHMTRHADRSGDIECEVCKFRFNTRRARAMHALEHAKKYACNECNFTTPHTHEARKHKQWHESASYKCDNCDEVSSKLTAHQSHVRLQHSTQFVCEECGHSFRSPNGVSLHKSRMHRSLPAPDQRESERKQEGNVFCAKCELQFSSHEAWGRHVATSANHRENLGSGCRQCGEAFPTASSLRDHLRDHPPHPPAPPSPSAPPAPPAQPQRARHHAAECEAVMPSRIQHRRHYQQCHQDKRRQLYESNFFCDMCGKGYQSNAFLVYHKRTHFAERPYKFGRSQKTCHRRAKLHTDHRMFACTICMNTFKTKLGLHLHFKTHSSIRPFPCQYCGKAFPRGSCLTQHVKHIHLRPLFVADK